jgi:hypothetical protein
VNDKTMPLLLEALRRAARHPAGLPLYGTRKSPGLFPNSALARQAAQRSEEEGWLRPLTPISGRRQPPVYTLTDRGWAFLLEHLALRPVLEDLVQAIAARQAEIGDLLCAVQQLQTHLETVRTRTLQALARLEQADASGNPGLLPGNGALEPAALILAELQRWQARGVPGDCPLPVLYRAVHHFLPTLRLGAFHDCLRQLHDAGHIYLHPWTGPLDELPEPACALLHGHSIAYYASLRSGEK